MNDCAGGADPPASTVKFKLLALKLMESETWLRTTLMVALAWPLEPASVIVMFPVFNPGIEACGIDGEPDDTWTI